MKGYALVAEPDVRLQHILARLVTDAGYEPVLTRDGVEARETMAARGLPGLVVVNLGLPRVDGFTLLTDLRRVVPAPQCPAVVVSGSMALRTAAHQRRHALGIVAQLASGMTVDSMRATLLRALDEPGSVVQPLPLPPAVQHAPPLITPRPAQAAPTPAADSRDRQGADRGAPPATAATDSRDRQGADRAEPAPRHADPQRLARIASMGIVDNLPADEVLQKLVEDTAKNFDVPVALVSIVLGDRQWFKAHVGLGGGRLLEERGTPIQEAFCRHVVDSDRAEPLVVPDAAHHPVFAADPLVVDGTIGSYAGAPLTTSRGDVLGTLCIIDQKPRGIRPEEVDQLVALARRVAGELELRSRAERSSSEAARLRQALSAEQNRNKAIYNVVHNLEAVLSHIDTGVMLLSEERRVVYANAALAEMLDMAQADLIGKSRAELVACVQSLSEDPEAVAHSLHVAPTGPYAGFADIELARPTWRVLRWNARPIDLAGGRAQLGTFTDVTAEALLGEDVTTASKRHAASKT